MENTWWTSCFSCPYFYKIRSHWLHHWDDCFWGWSKPSAASHPISLLIYLQAFQLVDKPSFHHLLQYLQPSLSVYIIPHCTNIHDKILNCSKLGLSQVSETLKVRESTLLQKFDDIIICGDDWQQGLFDIQLMDLPQWWSFFGGHCALHY